ncbi:exostosin family protein [Actinidia rufa]|uniref:Exostosin family protein n=1 Tax=Actinidia rufa TaxID=165716 RepID=A0A7J0EBZ8_9ERIC|nr:exostosin family protein [Actinidia rufa]
MKNAIWLLPDMDSTGNWYKPGQVFLEKDLILPYVPNVDFCDVKCLSEIEKKRNTLLHFRGRLKRNAHKNLVLGWETLFFPRGVKCLAGGKIRSKLVAELSGVEDVVIEEGTTGEAGKRAAQKGMRQSIFCLSPAGDTPSSARLFDAIVSGCIPVIVSDELELPFEGILDYRKIAIFVSSSDAVQPGWLLTFLRSVSPAQIREMQKYLAKVAGKLVNVKLSH